MRQSTLAALVIVALTGTTTAQAGAPAPTGFRFFDLDLRDPHVFTNAIGCLDVTDTQIFGFSVNNELQTRIRTDSDGDGFLDLSLVTQHAPLDPTQASSYLSFGSMNCTPPAGNTLCADLIAPAIDGNSPQTAATCLEPIAGTTRGYSPAVASATSPCFVSPAGTLVLDAGGIPLPLIDAQVASRFNGSPTSSLTSGLMRGFLRESDANTTLIPAGLPGAGQPVASLFPGGTGNCAAFDDRDVHRSESGWWFYFNFEAPLAVMLDGPSPLLADGFEGNGP